MCFARDTQHSMSSDTVASFENLAAETLEVDNDVISLSRAIGLSELIDELSRRFWCFRQKGYLYGNKLACSDCVEDLLIMDGDTVGSPAYVAYERGDLQGFEQHRYTKRCLDHVLDCEFCSQPLGGIRPVDECAVCLFQEVTNGATATAPSSRIDDDDEDDVATVTRSIFRDRFSAGNLRESASPLVGCLNTL